MPGDITKKLPAGNGLALLWSALAPSPKRKVPDMIATTSGFDVYAEVCDTCLYRKLDSAIMMMKSAEDRHRCDAAYVLDGAMDRSVFAKRPMSSQLVIISGILRQDPA